MMMQIIDWLGMLMDFGGFFNTLDDCPSSTPMPSGPKGGSRKVQQRLKDYVVKQASEGDGLRSGAHVLKLIKKFKYKKLLTLGPKNQTANTWTEPVMRRYLWTLRSTFTSCMDQVYSIAWDATRLSGKEMLFASLYCTKGLCGWSPPIVPMAVVI